MANEGYVMTTSMTVSLGTNTEMRSEKQGFEPLVLTAQTKPIKADEVLCTLKLSKLPGGVAPGKPCPIRAAHAWSAHHSAPGTQGCRVAFSQGASVGLALASVGTKPGRLGGE